MGLLRKFVNEMGVDQMECYPILDSSKLKKFADNNSKYDKNGR